VHYELIPCAEQVDRNGSAAGRTIYYTYHGFTVLFMKKTTDPGGQRGSSFYFIGQRVSVHVLCHGIASCSF
jgi:hypothetical protein